MYVCICDHAFFFDRLFNLAYRWSIQVISTLWTRNDLVRSTDYKNAHLKINCDELGRISELDFHILDANFQSFALAKSEAKMAAHGRKFCISVSVTDLHKIPGLPKLLKNCLKNEGIIRGLFPHNDNHWHRIFYWITTRTKARLGKDFLRYVFATYFLLCKTFSFFQLFSTFNVRLLTIW